MGELSSMWSDAKKKLSDAQKAQLPKQDVGKKLDEFEASAATALRALSDANTAVWAAYADGSKPKAESARALFEDLSNLCAKDKAINQAIGVAVRDIDRKVVGKMRGILKQNEDNLKKTIEAVNLSVRS